MSRPRFVMVCDEASGGTGLDVYAMPIEEFAKLFTWGREMTFVDGQPGERHTISALPNGGPDGGC